MTGSGAVHLAQHLLLGSLPCWHPVAYSPCCKCTSFEPCKTLNPLAAANLRKMLQQQQHGSKAVVPTGCQDNGGGAEQVMVEP